MELRMIAIAELDMERDRKRDDYERQLQQLKQDMHNMNTQQAKRNGSNINMSEPDTNNKTERFIHVCRVDLENMISDNESERCRLVSKLQQ